MTEDKKNVLQTLLDFMIDSFPWLFLTFIFLLLLSPKQQTQVIEPTCETKVVEKVVYRDTPVQEVKSTCEKRLDRYYELNREPPEWLVRGCRK